MIPIDSQARILRGRERIEHLNRLGMCDRCGEKQVMNMEVERRFGGRRVQKKVPITDREVYKGRHILCYGGHEALINLLKRRGEDVTELEKMWSEEKHRRIARSRQGQREARKKFQGSRTNSNEESSDLSVSESFSNSMTSSTGFRDSSTSFTQSFTSANQNPKSSVQSSYDQYNQSKPQEVPFKDARKPNTTSTSDDVYEAALQAKINQYTKKGDLSKSQQAQKQEQQRKFQQQKDQQRMEQQRMEQQRMEQQRMEQQRMEQQRMEQQRVIEEQQRIIQEQEKILQQQKQVPLPEICLDNENNTIVSELPDDDMFVKQNSKNVLRRQSPLVLDNLSDVERPPLLEERIPTVDFQEIAVEDLEENKTSTEKILLNLKQNSERCGLSLIYPAYEYLLEDCKSFKLNQQDGIDTLKDILLRYHSTHKNIAIHTLDILIKCAFDCHQFEKAWNNLLYSLFNKVIPNLKNTDVLVRTFTLIGCVFMSYSVCGKESTGDTFTAQERVLNEICQTHSSNERLLEAACTAWIYLTLYDKPNEPRQPQWMEIALNNFPNNVYLWSCISILCKNMKSTPRTMGWIKEIFIQNFPTENWSDTQAWCLYNASIHSKKSHILSPRSFHVVITSLFDEVREDAVMNIFCLLNSGLITSSPILEQNIVKIMERFSENLSLQEAACTLLAHIEISLPESSIYSVMKHIKQNGLQTAASCALQNFLKSSVATNRAHRLVLTQITASLKDLILTSHSRKAASLLWTMCCNDKMMNNAKHIADSCGEVILSMSLNNHTGDDQILGLMAYLLNAVPETLARHLNDDVNNVITEVMRMIQSVADSNLVELACNIIASLSSNDVWKLFLIGRDDIFPTLIPCVDKYPGPLKYDIFRIIYNLAMQLDDIASILNHDTLNHILNSFSDNQVVCENNEELTALDAFSAILPHIAPRFLVNGKGLVDSIVEILNRRFRQERVSRTCMLILCDLLFNVKTDSRNDQFKDFLHEKDTIFLIMDAMSAHLGCEVVQEKGCLILWSFSNDEYMRSLITEDNRLNVIFISMQCHLKCITLQEAGLGILASVSCVPFLRNIVSASNGIDIVLSVLWVNVEQESIMIKGLVALSNMVVNSDTNEIDIVGPQEMEIIIAAMLSFPYSCEVQLSACRVLRNLSLAQENVDLMLRRTEQLTGVLTEAGSNFPEECGERVDFILDRILSF